MGTSISQASPRTESWEILRKLYVDAEIPVDRVVTELWRADRREEKSICEQLANDAILSIFNIVQESHDASKVMSEIASRAFEWDSPCLSIEIASRAAIQSALTANPREQFIANVFSEAANYIVSRDLAGLVGTGTRNHNIPQGLDFKQQLLTFTHQKAAEYINEHSYPSDLSSWKKMVSGIVYELAKYE